MKAMLCLLLTTTVCHTASAQTWAFEETFDSLDPGSPSQRALPKSFDYTVTHRIHPRDMLGRFPIYRADHGNDCAGPAPPNPAMHDVETSHLSNGTDPDKSFFVCKKHMMSSMGHVAGYSVTSFWPRQEFDFSNDGVLEFDVNVNENPGRFWWEVLISPRDQLTVGAAEDFWPIDEIYPKDRIRFSWLASGQRKIGVGTGAFAPDGWTVNERFWKTLRFIDPDDPGLTDRRIRRRMRLIFENNKIHWDMALADGTMNRYSVDVPGGLPFTRGLVLFKTHAYTPHKDDNYDHTTWHWDNIRFSGPALPPYHAFESSGLAYLQANGNRPLGDSATLKIDLPVIGSKPKLFGQIHSPMRGQVQLKVNGNPAVTVHPHHYIRNNCRSAGWSSFLVDLPVYQLRQGTNTFEWVVGPRAACVEDHAWNGFTVKDLEVQFASRDSSPPPPLPVISARDLTVSESDGVANVRLSLSAPSQSEVTVTAFTQSLSATPGQDFYGTTQRVLFSPGQVEATVGIVVLADSIIEGAEQFSVRLIDPRGATTGTDSATVTLNDSDVVLLSLEDSQVDENAGVAKVDVVLSKPLSVPVAATVFTRAGSAKGGQDYYGFTRQLEFASGETRKSVSIQILNDTLSDPQEVFTLHIVNAVNAKVRNGVARIKIADDD